MSYKGAQYLQKQLSCKRLRVLKRYLYYDMKNNVEDFRITTPAKFANLAEVLGWCGKAVDALADRVVFRKFREDNFDMNGIYAMNNRDIMMDSAVLSALISSCSFLYLSTDRDGFPRMQVIDGSNATGELDPITYMLREGYAVLSRDKNGNPDLDAYFKTGSTQYKDYKTGKVWSVPNDAPYPLLVPVIHRPDASRPFGRSRISRACTNIMQGALRTLKRMEVSAEFYSFPQRYILGLADDSEFESGKASLSSFLAFSKDEDGDKPQVGQFSQQSMSPYIDQLRAQAAMFAGETGLTLDDLGFVTDNPSSAEAIKASHENLRLAARKAQRDFGIGFLNAGYLAACLRDQFPYKREQVYRTKATWEPIFEPDAAALSGIGDAIGKIAAVVPGGFDADTLYSLTGIDFGG